MAVRSVPRRLRIRVVHTGFLDGVRTTTSQRGAFRVNFVRFLTAYSRMQYDRGHTLHVSRRSGLVLLRLTGLGQLIQIRTDGHIGTSSKVFFLLYRDT